MRISHLHIEGYRIVFINLLPLGIPLGIKNIYILNFNDVGKAVGRTTKPGSSLMFGFERNFETSRNLIPGRS